MRQSRRIRFSGGRRFAAGTACVGADGWPRISHRRGWVRCGRRPPNRAVSLLRNNRNILPLSTTAGSKIAVIGYAGDQGAQYAATRLVLPLRAEIQVHR